MAFTTQQKKQLGTWLITIALLSATFSYVGYKIYDNKSYKFFQDKEGFLEFGIENDTKYCSHCEREFYLRLYKYVPFNETDKSASVIIPNKYFREMLKVELFDDYSKEKLDIPFLIQYKSGYRWYNYPPKTADLSLSTQRKQFKIIANIPEDTAVSGLIGIKVTIAGKEIKFEEDPIWWINGKPYNITILKDCTTSTEFKNINIYKKEVVYLNQTYCYDFPSNLTCIKTPAYDFTREVFDKSYIDLINRTDCEAPYGFQVNDRKILWKKYGWKTCSRNGSVICCEAEHQSDGNGKCEEGEGFIQINIKDFSITKNTISKTKAIKELMIE